MWHPHMAFRIKLQAHAQPPGHILNLLTCSLASVSNQGRAGCWPFVPHQGTPSFFVLLYCTVDPAALNEYPARIHCRIKP